MTDDQGYVHLERPGQKAGSLAFKESDIDEYVFSKELDKKNVWSMPRLTDVETPVEFKVIRHGPPEKLNLYLDKWPYKDELKRYSERCP